MYVEYQFETRTVLKPSGPINIVLNYLDQFETSVLRLSTTPTACSSLVSPNHTCKNGKWSGDLGPLHINLYRNFNRANETAEWVIRVIWSHDRYN